MSGPTLSLPEPPPPAADETQGPAPSRSAGVPYFRISSVIARALAVPSSSSARQVVRRVPDPGDAPRLLPQIGGPVGARVAGSDEQRAVRLFHEPDGRDDRAPALPAAGLDRDGFLPADELFEIGVAGHGKRGPYRPRSCQDLPSVATDGA